jgi:ribokinase
MPDIIVVGSYNAGLTIYSPTLPGSGETVVGDRFERGPGGKGANQAIGAKRLGGEVLLVTKLGDDVFGDEARRALLGEGLPAKGLLRGLSPTGIALILVGAGGENAISIAPGANEELSSDEVLSTFEEDLNECSFLLLQLECSPELAADMGIWARAHGKRTILDPAPVRDLPSGALGSFDILTPNETELIGLARQVGLEGEDVEALASGLVERGARDVIVTLGEEGALWASASGVRRFGAYPVEAVDTTGAGDAFNAALVATLARGELMDAVIDQGCRAGAFCATRRGVLDGLATPRELASLIATTSSTKAESVAVGRAREGTPAEGVS